jgi:hypothetical protein
MPHCSLGDELQEPLSVPPFVEVLEDVVRDALRLADFLQRLRNAHAFLAVDKSAHLGRGLDLGLIGWALGIRGDRAWASDYLPLDQVREVGAGGVVHGILRPRQIHELPWVTLLSVVDVSERSDPRISNRFAVFAWERSIPRSGQSFHDAVGGGIDIAKRGNQCLVHLRH